MIFADYVPSDNAHVKVGVS